MNVVARLVYVNLTFFSLETTTVSVKSRTQLSHLSQLVNDACRRVRPAQRREIVDAVGLVTLPRVSRPGTT